MHLSCITTVEDASGRYASAYFDGNNYWMGSLSSCQNIFIDDIDRLIELGKLLFGLRTPPINAAFVQAFT